MTGKQLAGILGLVEWWRHGPTFTDNPHGGKMLEFQDARLISSAYQSPPVLVYGKNLKFWFDLGSFNSGLGYPIADPQLLPDGSTCNIFQGGHVHQFGSFDPEM